MACRLTIEAGATTVFVTSVGRGEVQLIVNGTAVRQLGIGQSTVAEVVIPMTPDGRFRVTAYINGRPVPA
ncbi:MAG TPA: hypothetical protein VEU32_16500 [Burkholderiales bacterium]|nr:hypothetical protein [Burkholderiales bacterium]